MKSLFRKISRVLRNRMDDIIQEIRQERQKNPSQQTTQRRILSNSLRKILDLLVLITTHALPPSCESKISRSLLLTRYSLVLLLFLNVLVNKKPTTIVFECSHISFVQCSRNGPPN